VVMILGCGDGRGEATVVAFGLWIRYFFDDNGCCGGRDWVKGCFGFWLICGL
jgi:hypothetical protein